MTTFQAVVTAILTAFSELLPISAFAHHHALSFFFGWTPPTGPLLGTIYLGLFLALVVYFRYDFLSFFSQTLQVLIYRRKPTAIDEKLPIFLFVSLLVPAAAWFFLHEQIAFSDQPLVVAAVLAASGIPMAFLDSYTRKNKNHYDWNWVDALLLGVGQACFLIPGVGRAAGAFTITAFRNYSREGAAKFIFYAATPMLGAAGVWHLSQTEFHSFAPVELSSLTFWVTLVVSFATGLFVTASFLKQVVRTSLARYAYYRIALAIAIVAVYFIRGQ